MAWQNGIGMIYLPEELAIWVKRIKANGCKRIWVYFNNDREAHAIKNAREFTKQLKAALHW
jgi:uncharacterized protein YecE (DUF72 family)